MTAAFLAVGADGVSLRRASAQDVEPIVRLLADDDIGAGRESSAAAAYAAAFEAIDHDPSELLMVAVAGTAVIGTFQLSFLPGLSRGGALRAQIEAVRVASQCRGNGLGRAMIGWAVAEAGRRGCGLIQLTSDTRRMDAQRFYVSLGFTATHVGFKREL